MPLSKNVWINLNILLVNCCLWLFLTTNRAFGQTSLPTMTTPVPPSNNNNMTTMMTTPMMMMNPMTSTTPGMSMLMMNNNPMMMGTTQGMMMNNPGMMNTTTGMPMMMNNNPMMMNMNNPMTSTTPNLGVNWFSKIVGDVKSAVGTAENWVKNETSKAKSEVQNWYSTWTTGPMTSSVMSSIPPFFQNLYWKRDFLMDYNMILMQSNATKGQIKAQLAALFNITGALAMYTQYMNNQQSMRQQYYNFLLAELKGAALAYAQQIWSYCSNDNLTYAQECYGVNSAENAVDDISSMLVQEYRLCGSMYCPMAYYNLPFAQNISEDAYESYEAIYNNRSMIRSAQNAALQQWAANYSLQSQYMSWVSNQSQKYQQAYVNFTKDLTADALVALQCIWNATNNMSMSWYDACTAIRNCNSYATNTSSEVSNMVGTYWVYNYLGASQCGVLVDYYASSSSSAGAPPPPSAMMAGGTQQSGGMMMGAMPMAGGGSGGGGTTVMAIEPQAGGAPQQMQGQTPGAYQQQNPTQTSYSGPGSPPQGMMMGQSGQQPSYGSPYGPGTPGQGGQTGSYSMPYMNPSQQGMAYPYQQQQQQGSMMMGPMMGGMGGSAMGANQYRGSAASLMCPSGYPPQSYSSGGSVQQPAQGLFGTPAGALQGAMQGIQYGMPSGQMVPQPTSGIAGGPTSNCQCPQGMQPFMGGAGLMLPQGTTLGTLVPAGSSGAPMGAMTGQMTMMPNGTMSSTPTMMPMPTASSQPNMPSSGSTTPMMGQMPLAPNSSTTMMNGPMIPAGTSPNMTAPNGTMMMSPINTGAGMGTVGGGVPGVPAGAQTMPPNPNQSPLPQQQQCYCVPIGSVSGGAFPITSALQQQQQMQQMQNQQMSGMQQPGGVPGRVPMGAAGQPGMIALQEPYGSSTAAVFGTAYPSSSMWNGTSWNGSAWNGTVWNGSALAFGGPNYQSGFNSAQYLNNFTDKINSVTQNLTQQLSKLENFIKGIVSGSTSVMR